MENPYVYEGFEADWYDSMDELSEFDDLSFYDWILDAHPGTILDLACGTGRTLDALVASGREVWGLDSSPRMLEICLAKLSKRKRYDKQRIRLGDMRHFSVLDPFDAILVPGFSIQLLDGLVEWKACVECCRDALAPEGVLLLSTYFPVEMLASGRDEADPVLRKRDRGGQSTTREAWQGWRLDRGKRYLYLINEFKMFDSSRSLLGSETKEMRLSWIDPLDLKDFLLSCGFRSVGLYGDFTCDPPNAQTEATCAAAWK